MNARTTRRHLALQIAAVLSASCHSGSASPTAAATPPPATAGRFEVTLPGSGIALGGVLFRPEIPSGSRPAILVLHGWATAGTNGAALVEHRARRYSDDGYVALALSMRGWPPSRGADDCGLQQPDDVVQAVAWLGALPGVDPARVALVGFSQGGQVSRAADEPATRAGSPARLQRRAGSGGAAGRRRVPDAATEVGLPRARGWARGRSPSSRRDPSPCRRPRESC